MQRVTYTRTSLLTAIVFALAAAASGQTSCEPDWLPTFGAQPGTDGSISAFATYDDGTGEALYAGGAFRNAGGVPANFIAKWDGATWTPLGTGTGGLVFALAVFDDGSGETLYAGGQFSTAVGGVADGIARWDGVSWTPVGTGVGGLAGASVSALAVLDDGSGPALYAGGNFTTAGGQPASRVARWDGTSWTPLGSGVSVTGGGPATVLELAAFDDGSGPALYAGGTFTSADGQPASRIARWDGAGWTPLNGGVDGTVSALTVFDDGTAPELYVGGGFTSADGIPANHIARWDGAGWTPLGTGLTGPAGTSVGALTVFDDGGGAALYAGGSFTAAGGGPANRIARWDAGWSPLGTGIQGQGGFTPSVSALTGFDTGAGPRLYVSGFFASAGGLAAPNLAIWDGASWELPGGDGVSDDVLALAVFDDGTGPALHAGGRFLAAGGITTNFVGRWDGSGWTPLGSGLGNDVFALAVFDDGSGPALYAGGSFITAGGAPASRIARWDGNNWSPLGTGTNGWVRALAVFDDGSGPALYAGGDFSAAGGSSANRIARWDGSNWSALGSGISPASGSGVRDLAVFDDGSGPALYAGGNFLAAGGQTARYVARWDGSAWNGLGAGMEPIGRANSVEALAVFEDDIGPALYAGGTFDLAGGTLASNLARWDGTSWSAVGNGLGGQVFALAAGNSGDGEELYAAGTFSSIGGVIANRIARWNGATWATLGSGLNTYSEALLTFDDGTGPALFVGGGFGTSPAGDSYLAKWGCRLPEGARTYGTSSTGCTGLLAIGVSSAPQVGNAAFAITCTEAPPAAAGFLFAGGPLISPTPLLGIDIWVNPILALPIASAPSGLTSIPVPIANDPGLAGVQFDTQLIWIGPTAPPPCPVAGLSASNALALTIQP